MKVNRTIKQRDLKHLRRMALDGQGLIKAQPFGKGIHAAHRVIRHLGYVQLDTVSVVERAHNHVLYSRVPDFKPEMTNQLLQKRDIFEYWSHAAAFLPIEDFRFSLPYKQAIKSGQTHWFKNPDKKLMAELMMRIQAEGPLCSRDVEAKRERKSNGWWDWKPARKALEQLFMQGDLMVCDRSGFQKTYDLTERVLPSHINTEVPGINEMAAHLLQQQLHCHGVVSLKGLTYLRRNAPLRQAMKNRVNELLAENTLETVVLNSGERFFIPAGALDLPMTRTGNRVKIMSPFDNAVIQRERLKSVFDFDYQIECYVPADKRKYGYFCLPILYRDQFIGRMDCKAHRREKHLEIKHLYLEQTINDQDAFLIAFERAIKDFCLFQQCLSVSFRKVKPEHIHHQLNTLFNGA